MMCRIEDLFTKAFPMDGGRVLRGVLAERWGALRATRVAAGAGKLFAAAFAVLGLASLDLLLVLVAFFVFLGAEAEGRGVLVRALLGHLRVGDLVGARAGAVDVASTVYDLGERMLRERRIAFPAAEGGHVVGAVALEDVRRVPAEERGAATADASLFHVSLDLSSRADLLASHVAAGQFLPFRLPAAPYPIFLAISSSPPAPGLATSFDFLVKRLPGTPSACLCDLRPGDLVHVGGSVVGRGFEVGRIADARDVLVFATGSGIR